MAPPTKAASAKADAKADTKTYTVKVAINHDGELYEPGSEITLGKKQADPLLAVAAIAGESSTADDEVA